MHNINHHSVKRTKSVLFLFYLTTGVSVCMLVHGPLLECFRARRYLITAHTSVCVPAEIGAPAVGIQNQKKKKETKKETKKERKQESGPQSDLKINEIGLHKMLTRTNKQVSIVPLGFYGQPQKSARRVVVPDVMGGLAVWRHKQTKTKTKWEDTEVIWCLSYPSHCHHCLEDIEVTWCLSYPSWEDIIP